MSRNKKFFLKFGAIACVAALLIGLFNLIYTHGYYYNSVYGEVKKFENVPNHITFANFGTSHGLAAFRYDENDRSSFNFALSGEDIYHDFQTLKQFSDHLDKGCIVSIPVSYFSFCLSTDEPSQKRYYMYLDKQYIRKFSYETLIDSKYVPVLRSIEFLFKDIIGDEEINVENFMDDPAANAKGNINLFSLKASAATIENKEQVEVQQGSTDNNARIQMLDQHALTRSESWRSGRMVLGQKYREENTALLIEMIDYCREKGFRPVLLTIPVYSSLTKAFTEEELEKYYFSCIDEVVKETDILYIDYSKESSLINEPLYYNNSDHMSAEGGEAFLKRYKEDLKAEGYSTD